MPLVPEEPDVPLVPEEPDVPSEPEVPLVPDEPLVPSEPEVPLVPEEPEVPPVIVTVIFPSPSLVTDAPLKVIPETGLTVVVPSLTCKAEPEPDVIPVIDTLEPSLLLRVNVEEPLS